MATITFRTVSQSKNSIRFGERLNDKALRDFIPALYDTLSRGHRDIILDFRKCERAYPEAVLPIVALVDHRRDRGDSFRVLLPEATGLRHLFLNANWAHLLDPSQQQVAMASKQHVAARRYLTHPEQQAAVASALGVVLSNMDLSRGVIKSLEWAMNEVTDNVLNHAQSPAGGLVHVSTFREEHKIKLVVADGGRGIPTAMREAFPKIGDDLKAVRGAVQPGVTSIPDSGQGNGLAGTLQIAKCAAGSFRISSGKAQLNVFREPGSGRWREKTIQPRSGFHFPGTAVLLEISTDSALELEQALQLGGVPSVPVMDIVDLKYGKADELVIPVAGEGLGVGSRHAGIELRQKAINLLRADPDRRLVFDWTGIDVISSSFADEAVGKLFVELGPTRFASRVGHRGTEPLVLSLLDRAIMQRVAQSLASPGAGDGGDAGSAGSPG